MTTETIVEIPLDQLHDSPFNPRRTFNQESLDELAASIKAEGRIHEPLLVRPMWKNILRVAIDAADYHQIVFGHRRKLAGLRAGLTTGPCMVRTMTDEEAKRAQIAENLQRENVHPIEEGEGFQALITDHAYTADKIAEDVGQSRSYVYGRLKLLQACKQVRDACLAGEIGSEIALLFARQEPALQAKALAKLQSSQFYAARKGYGDGGKEGYRAVRDFLNEYFMLDLKEALWKLDDAELLPIAGACTTCPKRAGCAPEVFADVLEHKSGYRSKGGADICTDPDCFADKKKAYLKRAQGELEAKGKTVIAGGKARQIIDQFGKVKGGYVALADVQAQIKKAKISGAALQDLVATAQNPRDGKTKQVVKIEDLKAAGVKVAEPKATGNGAHHGRDDAAQKKREEACKAAAAANERLFMATRTAPGRELGVDELRLVAGRIGIDAIDSDDGDLLGKVWKLVDENGEQLHYYAARQALEALIERADVPILTQIILDVILIENVDPGFYSTEKPDALLNAADRWGVDVKAVMAAAPEEGEQPTPATPAKKKAKGKPAAEPAQADLVETD